MERAPRRLTLRRPRRSVKPGCPLAPRIGGANATLSERLRPRWNGAGIRHSCGGIAPERGRESLYRIGIFFIFIDFQRERPLPLLPRRLPRVALRPAAAGERAPAPGTSGFSECACERVARFAGTRPPATRLHLLRGACHRDAAAEYQKPAASRSFKGSRWPVHSTHGADAAGRATQGAPPNSSAAALKKTPTSL